MTTTLATPAPTADTATALTWDEFGRFLIKSRATATHKAQTADEFSQRFDEDILLSIAEFLEENVPTFKSLRIGTDTSMMNRGRQVHIFVEPPVTMDDKGNPRYPTDEEQKDFFDRSVVGSDAIIAEVSNMIGDLVINMVDRLYPTGNNRGASVVLTRADADSEMSLVVEREDSSRQLR